MFVSPLPGPPSVDGGLRGQRTDPTVGNDGHFRFKTFSSRRFLTNKRRFEAILPTPLQYTSLKQRALMGVGLGNALLTWEDCVSRRLQGSGYCRLHLRNPEAWTIHCPDHGPDWRQRLPSIIKRIETGDYPPAQGGYYDLILNAWN
jgi:hypothetical protein